MIMISNLPVEGRIQPIRMLGGKKIPRTGEAGIPENKEEKG